MTRSVFIEFYGGAGNPPESAGLSPNLRIVSLEQPVK